MIVACLIGTASKMASIACYSFGPLLIKAMFEGETDKANKIISNLLLVANILAIPSALAVGYLSDRFKIWKLLII